MLEDDDYLRDFAPFSASAAETELRDKIEIIIRTKQENRAEFKLNIARTTTFGALKGIVGDLYEGYELGTLYKAQGQAHKRDDKRPLKDEESPWDRLYESEPEDGKGTVPTSMTLVEYSKLTIITQSGEPFEILVYQSDTLNDVYRAIAEYQKHDPELTLDKLYLTRCAGAEEDTECDVKG